MSNVFFTTDFVSNRQDLVKTYVPSSIYYPYNPTAEYDFSLGVAGLESLQGGNSIIRANPSTTEFVDGGIKVLAYKGDHLLTPFDDSPDITVAGVFEVLPPNARLRILFGNLQTADESDRRSWGVYISGGELLFTYRDPAKSVNITSQHISNIPLISAGDSLFCSASFNSTKNTCIVSALFKGAWYHREFSIPTSASSVFAPISIGSSSYTYNFDSTPMIAKEFVLFDKSLPVDDLMLIGDYAANRHDSLG